MVSDSEFALVCVATAVLFVQSCWVLMALFTEISIRAASELSNVATKVTLELNVS